MPLSDPPDAAMDGDQEMVRDLVLVPHCAPGIHVPISRVRLDRGRVEANGENLDSPLPLGEAARDTGVAIAEILLRAALDRCDQDTPYLDLMAPPDAARRSSEPQPFGSRGGGRRWNPAAGVTQRVGGEGRD